MKKTIKVYPDIADQVVYCRVPGRRKKAESIPPVAEKPSLEDVDLLLGECIELLKDLKEVPWRSTAPKNKRKWEPGRIYLSYPEYPEKLHYLFLFLSFKYDMDDSGDKAIDELTEEEVGSYVTYIWACERFCDGNLAGYIKSGEFLKLLSRLKVLRDEKSVEITKN